MHAAGIAAENMDEGGNGQSHHRNHADRQQPDRHDLGASVSQVTRQVRRGQVHQFVHQQAGQQCRQQVQGDDKDQRRGCKQP